FRWAEGNYDQLPLLAEDLLRLNIGRDKQYRRNTLENPGGLGRHSNSPFAPFRASQIDASGWGSNRHPPEAVSKMTTEHFGQGTGAINECLARDGVGC